MTTTEKSRYYRRKRKRAGLCQCGQPPVAGRKCCAVCTKKARETRQRLITEGRCVRCGTAVEKGTTCVSCAKKEQKRHIEYYQRVLEHYGGKCRCCGESEPGFLTLDHTANNGAQHRRAINRAGGWNFYKWVIDNDFPADLQLLCYNCNCSKQRFDECPHAIKRREA